MKFFTISHFPTFYKELDIWAPVLYLNKGSTASVAYLNAQNFLFSQILDAESSHVKILKGIRSVENSNSV